MQNDHVSSCLKIKILLPKIFKKIIIWIILSHLIRRKLSLILQSTSTLCGHFFVSSSFQPFIQQLLVKLYILATVSSKSLSPNPIQMQGASCFFKTETWPDVPVDAFDWGLGEGQNPPTTHYFAPPLSPPPPSPSYMHTRLPFVTPPFLNQSSLCLVTYSQGTSCVGYGKCHWKQMAGDVVNCPWRQLCGCLSSPMRLIVMSVLVKHRSFEIKVRCRWSPLIRVWVKWLMNTATNSILIYKYKYFKSLW